MEEDGPNKSMTAGVSSAHLESELENLCREIDLVDVRLMELTESKSALLRRRNQLSAEIQARKKRRENREKGRRYPRTDFHSSPAHRCRRCYAFLDPRRS